MRSENETRSRYLTFRVPHSALHMRFLLVVVLCTCSAASCRAQATNLSIYQDLAVHCLGDLPDTLRAFRLDAPATEALQVAARRHGVTVNTLAQAAWALVLARHTGGLTTAPVHSLRRPASTRRVAGLRGLSSRALKPPASPEG